MRRTTPVGLFETVEPAPPLSHVIKERHAPWAKFESKDEWLVTSDWELTYHFRASPHIYLRRSRHLHSSFLIPHSSYEQSFHPQSRDSMSPRLILNPEPPKTKRPDSCQVFLFASFIMQCIDRIQLRRLLCRIEAENKADQTREDEGADDGPRCDVGRDL